MINANELRIGNWVLVNRKFIKVDAIDETGINGIPQFSEYGTTEYDGRFKGGWFNRENENILPIPLTPEILERCGFAFVSGSNGWYEIFFDKYSLSYSPLSREIAIEGDSMVFLKNKVVRHLHQLQNLYFALTGTELNYTP